MLLSPMPKKKAQGNGNFNLCTEHSHKAVNQRRHMRERQAADWGGGGHQLLLIGTASPK